MSRRFEDIPIRPRYGIPAEIEAEENEEAKEMATPKAAALQKSRKTSLATEEMVETSSYTEIPFLAQYPGEVPEDVLKNTTPIAAKPPTLSTGDSLDDDDEPSLEDMEDNSNSSSGAANKTPKRPVSLQCDSSFPYELEGATSTTGEMRHFVAANLEEKLRSPLNKTDLGMVSHSSTPSTSNPLTRRFLQTQVPQIDANVLSDIEIESQYLAASVDSLTENLCNLLHSISSITADNVELHKNAVNKLTDSMDANIKCMYTIMAKTEEISKSMKPTEQLGQRIREIKRLVDMLDGTM